MQSNFPKTSLLFSIIFFVCSLFVFLFFYRAINENNQKAQEKEEAWLVEKIKREEMKTLDNSVKMIESERAQLETHFAESSDVVPFLDTVEGLASKLGVDAEVVSVNILTDYTGLTVGIKAEGTFSSLYKFLALLENSSYEIEVTSINMQRETELNSAESKNASVPKWNINFEIKLLSFVK